jgi:hypothetical protein
MQKENKALWKAKPLLTKLVGDNTWAPCGLMTAPDDRDASLFIDTVSFFNRAARRMPPDAAQGGRTSQQNTGTGPARAGETDGELLPDADAAETNGELGPEAGAGPRVNGNAAHGGESKDGLGGEDVEMGETAAAAANSSTTTAPAVRAALASLHAASPAPESVDDEFFIHPLFRPPPAAHPDRDLGLPEQEAEEVRRLLLLYVQKQEEICRGTKKLYEGLLKADRLRQTVWKWSKAEAHCGPNRDMSDGEDWYDKEEWGLTEDLKKGEDEVEEDSAQTQKKTRNRK